MASVPRARLDRIVGVAGLYDRAFCVTAPEESPMRRSRSARFDCSVRGGAETKRLLARACAVWIAVSGACGSNTATGGSGSGGSPTGAGGSAAGGGPGAGGATKTGAAGSSAAGAGGSGGRSGAGGSGGQSGSSGQRRRRGIAGDVDRWRRRPVVDGRERRRRRGSFPRVGRLLGDAYPNSAARRQRSVSHRSDRHPVPVFGALDGRLQREPDRHR